MPEKQGRPGPLEARGEVEQVSPERFARIAGVLLGDGVRNKGLIAETLKDYDRQLARVSRLCVVSRLNQEFDGQPLREVYTALIAQGKLGLFGRVLINEVVQACVDAKSFVLAGENEEIGVVKGDAERLLVRTIFGLAQLYHRMKLRIQLGLEESTEEKLQEKLKYNILDSAWQVGFVRLVLANKDNPKLQYRVVDLWNTFVRLNGGLTEERSIYRNGVAAVVATQQFFETRGFDCYPPPFARQDAIEGIDLIANRLDEKGQKRVYLIQVKAVDSNQKVTSLSVERLSMVPNRERQWEHQRLIETVRRYRQLLDDEHIYPVWVEINGLVGGGEIDISTGLLKLDKDFITRHKHQLETL